MPLVNRAPGCVVYFTLVADLVLVRCLELRRFKMATDRDSEPDHASEENARYDDDHGGDVDRDADGEEFHEHFSKFYVWFLEKQQKLMMPHLVTTSGFFRKGAKQALPLWEQSEIQGLLFQSDRGRGLVLRKRKRGARPGNP